MLAMLRLRVPSVTTVIGEGGSGGALAIAVADRVLMLQNSIYSVITPEGCAAILWKDAKQARRAAAAFKPTANHCLELGVIDAIVPEPSGGAHRDFDRAARLLGEALDAELAVAEETPPEQRRHHRRAKYRQMGVWLEPAPEDEQLALDSTGPVPRWPLRRGEVVERSRAGEGLGSRHRRTAATRHSAYRRRPGCRRR